MLPVDRDVIKAIAESIDRVANKESLYVELHAPLVQESLDSIATALGNIARALGAIAEAIAEDR